MLDIQGDAIKSVLVIISYTEINKIFTIDVINYCRIQFNFGLPNTLTAQHRGM